MICLSVFVSVCVSTSVSASNLFPLRGGRRKGGEQRKDALRREEQGKERGEGKGLTSVYFI